MASAAKQARQERRRIFYAVASLASVAGLCVLSNDALVQATVQLIPVPYASPYALDVLSLLLYLHEPNKDLAIEQGVLTTLSCLPNEPEIVVKALSILVNLCTSQEHQERIAREWWSTLLALSSVDHDVVVALACTALARLTQHNQDLLPVLGLNKGSVQPLVTLSVVGNRIQQTDAAKAIEALVPYSMLMDQETCKAVMEALNVLVLSKYVEPQAVALRTLCLLSRQEGWRGIIASHGCLYNMLLAINGRLSDTSRKRALKALIHFADDRHYRLRVGEGGLSSIIKTTLKNPYDEVKAPAVTILAILASNDSYRNRILGTPVLDKIVGYMRSPNKRLRVQSAHLLIHLAATDESRVRAAELNAAEALVTLFNEGIDEKARLYCAAAIGQLALTASVRHKLGSCGAVEALMQYLIHASATSGSPDTRAHCFAALLQLSVDDELSAKMKNDPLMKVALSSSESQDREEQMWALRALFHLSSGKDGKTKLKQLDCEKTMNRVKRQTRVPEVKLLADEVLTSLKARTAE